MSTLQKLSVCTLLSVTTAIAILGWIRESYGHENIYSHVIEGGFCGVDECGDEPQTTTPISLTWTAFMPGFGSWVGFPTAGSSINYGIRNNNSWLETTDECHGPTTGNDDFFFEKQSNGYYTIQTGSHGNFLCWDVPNGSSAEGVDWQLYPCHGGDSQQFWLTQWNDHTYIYPKVAPGKCADVEGGLGNGRDIQQYTCHWGPNQRFGLIRTKICHNYDP